jgi:hypothetical protein
MDEDDNRRIIRSMITVTDRKVIYSNVVIITNAAHDFFIE